MALTTGYLRRPGKPFVDNGKLKNSFLSSYDYYQYRTIVFGLADWRIADCGLRIADFGLKKQIPNNIFLPNTIYNIYSPDPAAIIANTPVR